MIYLVFGKLNGPGNLVSGSDGDGRESSFPGSIPSAGKVEFDHGATPMPPILIVSLGPKDYRVTQTPLPFQDYRPLHQRVQDFVDGPSFEGLMVGHWGTLVRGVRTGSMGILAQLFHLLPQFDKILYSLLEVFSRLEGSAPVN